MPEPKRRPALLLCVVTGPDLPFAEVFHLVAESTEENYNRLREKVADTWCRDNWSDLEEEGAEEMEHPDGVHSFGEGYLLDAFNYYFEHHREHVVDVACKEVAEFEEGELEKLVQARSSTDE